jgi:hypothetical protein
VVELNFPVDQIRILRGFGFPERSFWTVVTYLACGGATHGRRGCPTEVACGRGGIERGSFP